MRNQSWPSLTIDFKKHNLQSNHGFASEACICHGYFANVGSQGAGTPGKHMRASDTVIATSLVLAAFGSSLAPRVANAETFAYVGNAASDDISVFRLDAATGEMIPVQTAAFVGVEKPGSSTPLAISPNHRVLIAGVRSQPYAAISYAIDAKTGKLKHIGNGPLADSMANIAFDRTGRFLFSASYGGNKIALNPVDADGVVGATAEVIPTGLNAHALLPSPDNRFVFATNLGSDQVLAFKFDANSGALTPDEAATIKTPAKSGPRHFIFHPNGKFIYLLHELNADLAVYSYDADNGSWHEVQRTTALPIEAEGKLFPGKPFAGKPFAGKPFAGKPFAGKPWAADLHITPNGQFLYASERTSSTLTAYKVDAVTGKLTTTDSVPTETQPRGFNIDPSGRYLAAVGELSDGMTVYTIDQATGELTKARSYPVGKQPNWVEFVDLP
jgi:6-phosphogluconolactonase